MDEQLTLQEVENFLTLEGYPNDLNNAHLRTRIKELRNYYREAVFDTQLKKIAFHIEEGNKELASRIERRRANIAIVISIVSLLVAISAMLLRAWK